MWRPCLAAYPFNTLNEVMEGVGAKVSSPVFFWKFPSATRRPLPRTAVIPSCFNLSITCDGIDRFPSSFPSLESVHSNAPISKSCMISCRTAASQSHRSLPLIAWPQDVGSSALYRSKGKVCLLAGTPNEWAPHLGSCCQRSSVVTIFNVSQASLSTPDIHHPNPRGSPYSLHQTAGFGYPDASGRRTQMPFAV